MNVLQLCSNLASLEVVSDSEVLPPSKEKVAGLPPKKSLLKLSSSAKVSEFQKIPKMPKSKSDGSLRRSNQTFETQSGLKLPCQAVMY